jgi:hypothetical protein
MSKRTLRLHIAKRKKMKKNPTKRISEAIGATTSNGHTWTAKKVLQ